VWLHVAKIPGPDGTGAWLVVPGIEDRIFVAAMAQTPAIVPIRWLPTFGGWLVPLASEHVLWSVIAATYGDGIVCRQCLFGDMPCDAWIHLVEKRFDEAAKQHKRGLAQQSQQLVWLQPQQQPQQYGYQPWVPVYPNYPRPQAQPARETRNRWQSPPFEPQPPPRAQRQQQPPPPPPAPPPLTREQRIEAAVRVLGLTWPTTRAQVTKAFRIAALKAHPDLGGTDAAMRAVIEARDVLLKAA
jgi:hypothetical protein